MSHRQKGTQVNHTTPSAKAPSLRTGLFAARSDLPRGGGSGARSFGISGVGGRTPSLRLAALTVLVAAAFLALTAGSASAALPASFGTLGSGAGQVRIPRGIAVDQSSGDLYVADRGNARIDKFGPEGEFLLAFGWGVADGSAELQVCSTRCQEGLRGAGAGQFEGAEGIAVDNSSGPSQGDVYVLDAGNSRIEKFGPTGAFLLAFGEEGSAPGQFEGLERRSIAVGPTGTVYVGDLDRVQLFSEAGVVEAAAEIALPASGRTENLAVDSAGDIYRVAGELPGVHKYDPAGTELGSPRDEAGYREGLALAIGQGDELFVNNLLSGNFSNLLVFNPAGTQLAAFDAVGTSDETGDGGIAYSEATGAVYVLNPGRVRIAPVPPPGSLVLPGSEAATEITPATATLNATLNPEGAEATYRFQYVDAESFASEGGFAGPNTEQTPDETFPADFEDHEVSAAIENLQPRTAYRFRVLAESECEPVANPGHICVNPGEAAEFTTRPPVSIDATFATEVSATAATLGTELNPNGGATTYRFEYDTVPYAEGEVPHGTPTPTASAGSGTADILRSAQIQGLQPLTTYHYRVVAENEFGTSEGPDRSFTTQGPSSALLPDGRAWELVTPPNKHGAPVLPFTEEGGPQAAADGSAFASIARGPLGPESEGNRSISLSTWLSQPGPAGWSTADITTPHEEISQIVGPMEYKFFAEDLSASVVEPEGVTRLSPQASERTPYRREASGQFVPLVTEANVPAGTQFGGEEGIPGSGRWANGVEFLTASPDAGHAVLSSQHLLTEEFDPGFEANSRENLYEVSGGQLRLVSVLPDGEAASEAGFAAALGRQSLNMRGAISDDGSRVVFEAPVAVGNESHLYLRANATQPQSALDAENHCIEESKSCTIQVDAPQSGATGGQGVVQFQAASADGRRVFFTDESRLTADSTAAPGQKPDLYMCEVELDGDGHLACDLTDLSANHVNPAEPASVFGGPGAGMVSAIDSSGTHVFFAANGVLTETPNSEGEVARRGDCSSEGDSTCNLYLYDTETQEISLLAVLSNHDDPVWAGRTNLNVLGSLTARSSPDGHFFTFMSRRSLTGYDNRDAKSGEADEEVFLYDAESGELSCISCNPSGVRPTGVLDPSRATLPGLLVDGPRSWRERWLGGSIPGWTLNALLVSTHQSRYLSDSGRLFFNSSDALVPADTNGVMDVYEFEPPNVGDCTTASSTYSPTSGGCVSLVSSGTSEEESAFLDASETGNDVFFLTASRLTPKDVDSAFDVYDASVGGGEPPIVNPPACEGDACQQPAVPPSDATPGSLTFNGAGNLTECPKGKVKKKGKCVKKPKAKKHKKSHRHHKRAANNHRRAGR